MSEQDKLEVGCKMCSKKYDEFHKYMGAVAMSLGVAPSKIAITMIAQALAFELAIARESGIGVKVGSLVAKICDSAEEMKLKDDDEDDEFKNDPEIE